MRKSVRVQPLLACANTPSRAQAYGIVKSASPRDRQAGHYLNRRQGRKRTRRGEGMTGAESIAAAGAVALGLALIARVHAIAYLFVVGTLLVVGLIALLVSGSAAAQPASHPDDAGAHLTIGLVFFLVIFILVAGVVALAIRAMRATNDRTRGRALVFAVGLVVLIMLLTGAFRSSVALAVLVFILAFILAVVGIVMLLIKAPPRMLAVVVAGLLALVVLILAPPAPARACDERDNAADGPAVYGGKEWTRRETLRELRRANMLADEANRLAKQALREAAEADRRDSSLRRIERMRRARLCARRKTAGGQGMSGETPAGGKDGRHVMHMQLIPPAELLRDAWPTARPCRTRRPST